VGIWERIRRTALALLDQQGQFDWTLAFLDGSFVAAKRGNQQLGLTRTGKGTTWIGGWWWSTAMAFRSDAILMAPTAQRSRWHNWYHRLGTPIRSRGHGDASNGDQ